MIVKLASTKSMRVESEKIRVFAFGMFPWASGTRCCCLHISRCWMARGKWDASKDSYRGNSSPVLSGSAHPVNPAVNSFPHWKLRFLAQILPFSCEITFISKVYGICRERCFDPQSDRWRMRVALHCSESPGRPSDIHSRHTPTKIISASPSTSK